MSEGWAIICNLLRGEGEELKIEEWISGGLGEMVAVWVYFRGVKS